MRYTQRLACSLLFFCLLLAPQSAAATAFSRVNAPSAILVNMDSGAVLYEQNADALIPPASITKVLALYLVFDAIKEGRVHLSDRVEISKRAASTGGSRMGLKAGARVSLEELITGMAVVSGNDACVAVAEHVSGSVERFVKKMNAKRLDLGMTRSNFMTPNGLPAKGQVTTARDIAKLSMAYLRRYPESLEIHCLQSYTYGGRTHRNANRLLGKCAGVDGLKTGFVCASGYNISATAKRGGLRLLAVVMGARSAGIRAAETERLIEAGFRQCGSPVPDARYASVGGRSRGLKMSCSAVSIEKTGITAAKAWKVKGPKVVQTRAAAAGTATAAAKPANRSAQKKAPQKKEVKLASVSAAKTRATAGAGPKAKAVKEKAGAPSKSAVSKSANTKDKKEAAPAKKVSAAKKERVKTASSGKKGKSAPDKPVKRAYHATKEPKG